MAHFPLETINKHSKLFALVQTLPPLAKKENFHARKQTIQNLQYDELYAMSST